MMTENLPPMPPKRKRGISARRVAFSVFALLLLYFAVTVLSVFAINLPVIYVSWVLPTGLGTMTWSMKGNRMTVNAICDAAAEQSLAKSLPFTPPYPYESPEEIVAFRKDIYDLCMNLFHNMEGNYAHINEVVSQLSVATPANSLTERVSRALQPLYFTIAVAFAWYWDYMSLAGFLAVIAAGLLAFHASKQFLQPYRTLYFITILLNFFIFIFSLVGILYVVLVIRPNLYSLFQHVSTHVIASLHSMTKVETFTYASGFWVAVSQCSCAGVLLLMHILLIPSAVEESPRAKHITSFWAAVPEYMAAGSAEDFIMLVKDEDIPVAETLGLTGSPVPIIEEEPLIPAGMEGKEPLT